MVELLVTATVLVLSIGAELLHAARVRRVKGLAFGPSARPATWARFAPALRIGALGALAWGLTTLLLLNPKVHNSAEEVPESEMRHLLLVLDVSPSMRLVDAGVDGKLSRRLRARDLMASVFSRLSMREYLITVVAVYNGAIPVVEKTRDAEVVRNILDDLPLQFAFPAGGTDLLAGIKEAARIAHPWNPQSAALVILSDGDTVPATGMPRLPASISDVLVLGVGNPLQGKFIDGKQSRQDASSLRQIAARLGGTYHDGNEKHLATDFLTSMAHASDPGALDRLSRREYALLAVALGGGIFGLLPLALQRLGTNYRPGAWSASASPASRRSARRHSKQEATVSV